MAPEAMIGDWAEAIGKSRSSTLSALKRLRDADLAESIEGKWRLSRAGRAARPASEMGRATPRASSPGPRARLNGPDEP